MLAAIQEAGDSSVAVTVRRGQGWSNILSLNHYRAGAAIISRESEVDPHLFVFSDDADWIRDNFKLPYKTTIAATHKGSVTGHEAEDLWLTSRCKNAILAMSSFSWWGAWIGDMKTVIAPYPWESEAYRDIVPERWRKLNASL